MEQFVHVPALLFPHGVQVGAGALRRQVPQQVGGVVRRHLLQDVGGPLRTQHFQQGLAGGRVVHLGQGFGCGGGVHGLEQGHHPAPGRVRR